MFQKLFTKNFVYNESENKTWFKSDDLDIIFDDSKSNVSFLPKVVQPIEPKSMGLVTATPMAISPLMTLLPTAIDVVFRLTNSILENNVKKFTAEYTKQKSNLNAGNEKVPDFVFIREVKLDKPSNKSETAFKISFKAIEVVGIKGFCYYVEYIDLNYSSAKPTKNHKTFDYTIELKPTFLIDGAKKVQEISPLVITSVSFGHSDYGNHLYKHRTDIIPLPDGAALTEVSIKIIESNPVKVRAEKLLSLWNSNKDIAKTIINNFLPKEKEKGKENEKTNIQKRLKIKSNAIAETIGEINYISVLISDMNLEYWRAFQWSDSLSAIDGNRFYNSNESNHIDKNTSDIILHTKTIEDIITQSSGTAAVIELP
jgi:hypothetical protein